MLGPNWFMENMIDYEYQYYRLMHYYHTVRKKYMMIEVYPHLKNTIERLNEAENLLQNLSSFSLQSKDGVLLDLEKILEQGRDIFHELTIEGIELYEKLKQNIKLDPIHILTGSLNQGIVLFFIPYYYKMSIYNYSCSRILIKDPVQEYVFLVNLEKIMDIESDYKNILPHYKYIINKHLKDQAFNIIFCYASFFIPLEQVIEIFKRMLPDFVFENFKDFAY